MRTLLENLKEDAEILRLDIQASRPFKVGGRFVANDIEQAIAEIERLNAMVGDLLRSKPVETDPEPNSRRDLRRVMNVLESRMERAIQDQKDLLAAREWRDMTLYRPANRVEFLLPNGETHPGFFDGTHWRIAYQFGETILPGGAHPTHWRPLEIPA